MNSIKFRILEVISDNIDSQTRKGIKKYGQSIDDVSYTDYDWQVMLIEELIDGIQYVVKDNKRLHDILKTLNHIEHNDNERLLGVNLEHLVLSINKKLRKLNDTKRIELFKHMMLEYISTVCNGRINTINAIENYKDIEGDKRA